MLITIRTPRINPFQLTELLYAPPDDYYIRNRACSSSEAQEPIPPVSVSSNGVVDVGEISLADMNPEDIRVKSLYIYIGKPYTIGELSN